MTPRRVTAFPGRHRNLPDQSWLDRHPQFGIHWPHGGMLAGLDALMGALGVTLSTDKSVYKVGEKPTYRISGGVPGGGVAWTSFRNGQPTGEFQADYGQDLTASGTLTIEGGPWSASDVGDWQKQILIVPVDYAGDYSTLATAQVEFTVVGAGAASSQIAKPRSTSKQADGFFEKKVDIPVVGNVPLVAVLGIGVVGFFLLSGKGRK